MSDQKSVATRKAQSDALERLRDRTDELELIISSLTIFALVSVPGWLFDRIADSYTHLSTSLVIAGMLSTTLLAGACYGLAACFVIHLMARSYWVGLIGLRTVFPDGINWSKTPGLGPLSRRYYQDTLPDLDTIIKNTDKLASSLFAVISMLTLIVLWFGTILVVVLVTTGAIGASFGLTNAGIGAGTLALLIVFLGAPVLVYLLDAQLAARIPSLGDNPLFGRLIRLLRRVAGLAYPQRLVVPVQLTLQSNTRPVVFYIALVVSISVIVSVGNVRAAAWRNFTVSDEFSYLDIDDVRGGFRSTYYEDMSSPLDRLRGWPRIDSFNQSGSFVTVFLPYQPIRDNLVLDQLCNTPTGNEDVEGPSRPDSSNNVGSGRGDRGEDAAPTSRVGADGAVDSIDCLRRLWSISIEGKPVSMAAFMPAERADIGMRGLVGLVPLSGLKPGLNRIEAVWNPSAADEAAVLDDRYNQVNDRYIIPIAFSPTFEATLNSNQ
ncbi:MAG: hypothetical protein AAGC71_14930 [Pseudomonadota bacterium]